MKKKKTFLERRNGNIAYRWKHRNEEIRESSMKLRLRAGVLSS